MSSKKCCVLSCSSTNSTHRLFNLPKDDKLRALWLSFLVPINSELITLSKEQLINKSVCQVHFDRYQFDKQGNRLQSGYPCLFSTEEIHHGIPLSSSGEYPFSEHNYYATENSSNEFPVQSPAINNYSTQGCFEDHLYAKQATSPTLVLPLHADKSVICIEENETPSTSEGVTKKSCKPRISLNKGTGFAKKLINIAMAENGTNENENSFLNRYSKAKKMSEKNDFIANMKKMSHYAQTFILMQLNLIKTKKMATRFSVEEKILSLMKESPKGYRFLQKIFRLPTKRTLNRFAEKIVFKTGINDSIFELLKRKSKNWDSKKRLCSIMFDEVALTPHINFVEAKDEIEGFLNTGHEKFLRFCDHALVIMIRGVCSSWRQPLAFYFCEGTMSSISLKKIIEEIVLKLTICGLKPICIVCDQGQTFRKTLNMLKIETERNKILKGEHVDGTIEINEEQLSIVHDPPHLIKSIRNNFLTKDMVFNQKIASWKDIITIYDLDCRLGHTRMLPKLTEQHIVKEKIKKMKVSLAAQVLSARTSAMLKYTASFKTLSNGEPVSNTMLNTAEAIEFWDNLFDSVNGSRRSTNRGKLRRSITKQSKHIEFWQEAIKKLELVRFMDTSSKRATKSKKINLVRVPCLEGWIISLKSFIRISKLLFNVYDVKYFYGRNINQDPLENFFGRIRALNWRNTNPDAYTFSNSYKSLLMSNIMGPHSLYSNCEEDFGEILIDFNNLFKKNVSFFLNSDKENVDPNTTSKDLLLTSQCLNKNLLQDIILEKVKVHSSAYTAGYVCRKLRKRLNCQKCIKTYLSSSIENIHDYIVRREYKKLKNSNLAYPTKAFMMLYRDCSNLIHSYLNSYAHKPNIGKKLRIIINNKLNLNIIGCEFHSDFVQSYFLTLIIRLHTHNWCNIINKILSGKIAEKYVVNMKTPQQLALAKFKALRLRSKRK